MALSPALLAQLAARGIIPPQSGQPPPGNPFGAGFAGAGLSLPDPNAPPPPAPPPNPIATPPPSRTAAVPSLEAAAAQVDARNAAGDVPMTPADRAAIIARSGETMQRAVGGIAAPHVVVPPATAPQGPVEGVFAQPQGQDRRAPLGWIGAGGMVPGHAVSMVSPESRAMFDRANADKMGAANLGQMADMSNADMQVQALQGQADALEQQRQGMAEAEARRAKAYDEQEADYRRYAREAAEGKIDPTRASHVGFMGRLALALSAGGSSLTHTPDALLESLNKRIDDDISAQRANLENKHKAAQGAMNGLQEMRARFGDDRVAEAAERARQLAQAKAIGDTMVARSQSPMVAAKWEGIKAGIEAEQAAQHAQLEKWVPPGMGGGNLQAIQNLAAKWVSEGRYRNPDDALTAATRLMSTGQMGANLDALGAGGKVSPRIAMRQADVEDADRAAQRLQNLLRNGSSLSPSQKEQAKADAALLRAKGYTTIPENPLEIFSMSGPRSAGLEQVRKQIADQRRSLGQFGAGGAGPEEGPEDEDAGITPAGR